MGRLRQAVFQFKPFSRKQKKILTWWLPESGKSEMDGIIADGAIRSGKTLSMALSFMIWSMESFSDQNFALCGKTIGSFRRNVLFSLKLMLTSRGYRWKDHRADNLLEVSRKGKTNYYYIYGGKDERSQDLIQGITLAGILFDEVALMPESFVNQATGRCSVEGSKMWFNCNPEGPAHWFKVRWIDYSVGYLDEAAAEKAKAEGKELKNLLYLHFTMDDNLSLAESIKTRYRSMYSGVFFRRFIEGLWVAAEGVIYDMFDADKHVIATVGVVSSTKRYVSVDYGTQNPTVYLLWEQREDGGWHCCREYYHSGRETARQKTDAEYSAELIHWLGDTFADQLIVDPSAASFIAQLKRDGFRVKPAKNAVLDGIRLVASLLTQGRISFSPDCEQTIREFGAYVWDNRAADRGEDKPLKDNDHCMDAMRYFCRTIIGKRGLRAKQSGGDADGYTDC